MKKVHALLTENLQRISSLVTIAGTQTAFNGQRYLQRAKHINLVQQIMVRRKYSGTFLFSSYFAQSIHQHSRSNIEELIIWVNVLVFIKFDKRCLLFAQWVMLESCPLEQQCCKRFQKVPSLELTCIGRTHLCMTLQLREIENHLYHLAFSD